MPPPFSSIDSAPKTSSTSGFRFVRDSGITAPSASAPVPAAVWALPWGPALSCTNFSPSRLDWRSSA